jgi:hypothetical protein
MSAANANAARTACPFESVHRLMGGEKSGHGRDDEQNHSRSRKDTKVAFDQLVERLNAFMMLTMWRIQDLRPAQES